MDNTPIFVKIDEYKDILKVVESINGKLNAIRGTLSDLKAIKAKEDENISKWNTQLDKISEKMSFINDTMREM